MTTASVETASPEKVETPARIYAVGERVLWKALFNNGGHRRNYYEGEVLTGTVIATFKNGGHMTYRVELDRVWVERADCLLGKKIVVGNVTTSHFRQLQED